MSRRTPRIDALSQDASYPRPQLVRSTWHDLGGEWDFTHDPDATAGVGTVHFDDRIIVPFPPESPASGIARTDFLNCVWYRRTIGPNEMQAAGAGDGNGRIIVHFGAVDHEATVWVNETMVATHRGGQTPFSADITDAIDRAGDNDLVVRAADPAEDVSILRGKQDWREAPHAIWYHRTTGIWQPVWLESVPSQSISDVAWSTDITAGTVDAVIRTRGQLPEGARLRVTVQHGDVVLAETPSNPGLDVVDLHRLALTCRSQGTVLVVDNTTATPLGQQPLSLGADLVVGSATKALSGHHDVLAGYVAGSHPDLVERVLRERLLAGSILGAFEAWLVLRSLGSAGLRFERQCHNAAAVALMLSAHPAVRSVRYPGLPDDPSHPVAAAQMRRFGGLVSVELADAEAVYALVERSQLLVAATSFGGIHSSVDRRARWGDPVSAGFARISLGIEDTDDLLSDLDEALSAL